MRINKLKQFGDDSPVLAEGKCAGKEILDAVWDSGLNCYFTHGDENNRLYVTSDTDVILDEDFDNFVSLCRDDMKSSVVFVSFYNVVQGYSRLIYVFTIRNGMRVGILFEVAV